MVEKHRFDQMPFRETPVSFSPTQEAYFSKLFLLSKFPGIIVRKVPEFSQSLDEDQARLISTLTTARQLYNELPAFGIQPISFQYVIAQENNLCVPLSIADRVTGEQLFKLFWNSPQVYEPIAQRLCAQLAEYFIFKYHKAKPYLSDIQGMHQFMFGTLPDEKKPVLRLIDVDPLFEKLDGDHANPVLEERFFKTLNALYHFIESYELKGVTFLKAKRLIEGFIEESDQETANWRRYKITKNYT